MIPEEDEDAEGSGGKDGPCFVEKLKNTTATEGKDIVLTVKVKGEPWPNIKWFKGTRELKTDDQRMFVTDKKGDKTGTFKINKSKISDEGKYQVVLEHDGFVYDACKFSLYVKDPKDSGMDFRAMLKTRDGKHSKEDDEELDFGTLKPGKPMRRLSRAEKIPINIQEMPGNESKPEVGDKKHPRQTDERDPYQGNYQRSERDPRDQRDINQRYDENSGDDSEGPDTGPRRKSSTGKGSSLQVPGYKEKLQLEIEDIEGKLNQRRKSQMDRRTSLAEIMPDWPGLKRMTRPKEEPDTWIEDLKDQKVMEGKKQVVFRAKFCKPNAKYRWYKNKLEIFHSHKYDFEVEGDIYTLTVKKIDMSDAGRYICKCNDVPTQAWLNVEQKAQKYRFNMALPDQVQCVKKKEVTLECSVSDPRAHVNWFRNDEPLEPLCLQSIMDRTTDGYKPGFMEIKRRENRCLLTIKKADYDDAGIYMCKVEGDQTQTELIVKEPPYHFTRKLKDVEATVGDTVPLRCEVDDDDATVRWYKDGDELICDGEKYEYKRDGEKHALVIRNSTFEDEGNYTAKCGQEECTAGLTVEPDVKFLEKLHDIKSTEKQPVRLECKAKNPHKHPTTWFKNGQKLESSDRMKITEENGKEVLVIDELSLDDEGKYTCQIGDKQSVCELTVEEGAIPPEIDEDKIPKLITVKAGEKIDLPIPYRGLPTPSGKWTKNGQPIPETVQLKQTPQASHFLIPTAKRDDSGKYELELTNPFGTKKVPVEIKVLDVPGAPKSLDVSDVFRDKCKLKWDKPEDDGGLPIKHYVVEKMDTAKGQWDEVGQTSDLNMDVGDLTPMSYYKFRVRAVNEQGPGQALHTDKDILAKDPYDPPDPPSKCTCTDWDKNHADLSWEKPKKDGGNPIQKFVLQKRLKTGGNWEDAAKVGPDETKGVIPDLEEGKEYEFRVLALNAAGLSDPSNVTPAIVAKDRFVKPHIATRGLQPIKVKAGQKFQIDMKFIGEPTPDAHWDVSGKPLVPTDATKITMTETNAVFANNKAQRGDTGVYKLTLTNSSGSDSAEVEVVVMSTPQAPEGPLEVSDVTKESCKLTWKKPKDDGGTDITAYCVEKMDQATGTWEKVSEYVPGTTVNVPKLKEGHQYKFRVMAENSQGRSEPLETERATTAKNPFDEPDSPGTPEIVDHDRNRIDLKWGKPLSDGGNPIKGYIIERKEVKSNRWVRVNPDLCKDTKFADESVKEGREYEYRVSAVNEAGPSEPSKCSAPVVAKPSKEAPKIDWSKMIGGQEVRVRAGSPLNLAVPISGAPAPTAEWARNGRPISADARTKLGCTEEEAKLDIPYAKREDTGKYTITLKNPYGTESGDIKVTVLDKPKEPTGPLVVDDLRADSCKLVWKEPEDDGGGEITGYVVEKLDPTTGMWERVPGVVNGTSHPVRDLVDGKKYQFRVKAENMYGTSEPLTTGEIIAKNPFDSPDAPKDLKIDSFDRYSCQLAWKAPNSDGGNPISGYVVEKRDTRGNDWVRCNTTPVEKSKYNVMNLSEGHEYEFRVAACNEAGPGKFSKATEPHVARDPIFKAGSPTQPNVDKITKDSVSLSWGKPIDDGGGKIKGYMVEKKPKGAKDFKPVFKEPIEGLQTTIPDLVEGEECEFRIVAVNEAGPGDPSKPTDMIKVENQPEKPKINTKDVPREIVVKAGENFDIKIPFDGWPIPTATWELNDKDLEETSRHYAKVKEGECLLKVSDAKRGDTGTYKVALKNPHGTDHVNVRVKVLDAPSAPEGPLEGENIDASTIDLTWKAPLEDGCDPVSNYILEKRPVGSPDWQKCSSFLSSPHATVRNLDPGKEYEFRVMAENKHGVSEPLVTSEPIKAKHPFDTPGEPGEPKCVTTSEDSVSLAWSPPRKDGGAPIKGYVIEKREKGDKGWQKASFADVPGTEYTVKGLKEGKDYEFRVAAVNAAGPGKFSECSESIKARAPPTAPKIEHDFIPRDITVKAGEEINLKIPFSGSPVPETTWSLENSPITKDDRTNLEVEPGRAMLTRKKACKKDAGRYIVNMKNEKGFDSFAINVNVVDKPVSPEGPLEVSHITPDSCSLNWKAPKEDGGSPVSNYIVEKMDDKTGAWEPCSRFVRGTSYDVMGLDEGHKYKFRVRAENEHGVSEPLETERATVAQHQFATPDKPGKPEVDDVDEDSVTLSWQKPKDDGGDKVTGYQVEMKEEGSSKWKPVNDFAIRDTFYTVDGLKKGQKYDFRVKAKNRAGYGEPSTGTGEIEAKPKYSTASSPGAPEVKGVGKNFVELEWEKPKSDGGSRITGYLIEKKNLKDGEWVKASDYNTLGTNFTLTDLPEGEEFEFRVSALNAAGQSKPSPGSMPVKVKEKLAGTKPEFIKKIDGCTAPVGGEAVFTCMTSGKPEPNVTWMRNGVEIFPSSRCQIKQDDDKCVLVLKDLAEGQSGEITCEVANKMGRESCSAKLEVQSPPKLGKPIKDQKVDEGDSLKVKVPFEGTGPFKFKLRKNGKEIPETDHVKFQSFDDYVVFHLKDADKDDTAKYSIDISNDSGTLSAPINVKVLARPDKPSDVTASDVTKSTCRLNWKAPKEDGGAKITHYIVERKDVNKPYWATVQSFCKEPYCDVSGLYENNEYLFRVCAVNANGEGEYCETSNPIVAKMPFDPPGQPGEANAEEVGADFVSLTWEKPRSDGGGKITGYWIERKEPNMETWTRCNHQPVQATIFNVPNLIEDREYEFRITAENPAGLSKPSTTSRKVKVKDPNAAKLPEFVSGLKKTTCNEGKNAKFECEILGEPKPTITWYKGTRELFGDDPKYETIKDGDRYTLIVHDVYGEDADEYVVRATNKGGSRASRADLIIKSPPHIRVPARFQEVCTFEKGEDVVIKIPFTGNPKPDVQYIRDNQPLRTSGRHTIDVTERHAILTIKDACKADEGPYRLQLENELGTDSAVIKIQVNDRPDPPRFPQVENVYDDSCLLTWKPPNNDGGSFVNEYHIEKREPPRDNWVRISSCRFNTQTVQGLSPDHEYELRIIAENFYGKSDPCEPVQVKTSESSLKKRGKGDLDEFGRKVRGHYDGPKIDNYDKFYYDLWAKYKPTPVDIKTGNIYDDYDILEELGSGAFGVVHRCREKATGRIFVAKFIPTPFPLDKVTVRNEIGVMNDLHHPKLMHLYDAFDGDGEMCLIMEFLSGGELFDRVADDSYKMCEAEVINYMRQVCDGISHMHDNCYVHLDIKPENIICENSKSPNIKMIDFGLATKLNPDEIVKVTTATAEFAAPEIVDMEPVGYYTDIWALGVLAYVLLSGLSPFAGEDDLETLQNVKRGTWDFDSEGFKNISDEGKDFIRKCLQKQPGKRLTIHECLEHKWLTGILEGTDRRIPSSRYAKIRQRIQDKYGDWPIPQPAIGRIAQFSSLRKRRPKEFQIYDTYFDRREAIPRFILKPRNQTVQEGNPATFDCRIIALSPPVVTWIRDGVALTQSGKYMQKYLGRLYELRIGRSKLEDKGEYIVKAENSFGNREAATFLTVELLESLRPPSFTHEPTPIRKLYEKEIEMWKHPQSNARFAFTLRDRHLQEGIGFKLLCTVEGFPPATVQWYKDGPELNTGDHYQIVYSVGVCSLEVTSCTQNDNGRYSCIAKNQNGEDETNCKVVVAEKIDWRPAGLDMSNRSLGTSSYSSRVSRHTDRGGGGGMSSSYESSSSRTSKRSGRTTTDESSYSSSTTSSSSSSRTSRRAGKTVYEENEI
ncbi:twitchin-like isoform X9 [Lineus longissimus]